MQARLPPIFIPHSSSHDLLVRHGTLLLAFLALMALMAYVALASALCTMVVRPPQPTVDIQSLSLLHVERFKKTPAFTDALDWTYSILIHF